METLVFIAGLIQISILSASLLVPVVLDYTNAFSSLKPMVRKLIWVYGVYLAGTILFLGLLSTLYPDDLLSGGVMNFILAFYLIFWGVRLYLQLFVYEMKEHLISWWMKLGYNMLTLAFTYLTSVYTAALFIK
ncbi:MAG: hypothetical protein NE327_04240 [Lentisphaeraceae bacterium]|nr:hypothetical protein [Lentisphaeraceae bacterium]